MIYLHSGGTYIRLIFNTAIRHRTVTTERFLLDPTIGNYGVNIPRGQWHGIEVIEPSAIFEVKDGPYTPLTPTDILD